MSQEYQDGTEEAEASRVLPAAVSQAALLERLPVHREALEQPRADVRHPVRYHLLVGVDLVIVPCGLRFRHRDGLGETDQGDGECPGEEVVEVLPILTRDIHTAGRRVCDPRGEALTAQVGGYASRVAGRRPRRAGALRQVPPEDQEQRRAGPAHDEREPAPLPGLAEDAHRFLERGVSGCHAHELPAWPTAMVKASPMTKPSRTGLARRGTWRPGQAGPGRRARGCRRRAAPRRS